VSVWRGEALAAGDRIRIEVAAENYGHVAVFHEDAQRNTLLFQGVVAPHARTLLPRAWQLDAAETPERLAVVFSDAALDPRAAEALLRSAETAQHYVVRVVIEKGTKGE
jgi:hypothetical protein